MSHNYKEQFNKELYEVPKENWSELFKEWRKSHEKVLLSLIKTELEKLDYKPDCIYLDGYAYLILKKYLEYKSDGTIFDLKTELTWNKIDYFEFKEK